MMGTLGTESFPAVIIQDFASPEPQTPETHSLEV